MKRRWRVALATAVMLLSYAALHAQEFPAKPVRLITTEAGGSGDVIARLLAQALAAPLGQPLIVDNRSAIVGIEAVARAAPDGYTLLVPGATLWMGPLLQPLSYDPIADFSPVSLL